MKRIATVAAAVAIIATALAPSFATAAGNTVTVTVSVRPRVQVTRVDDALVVRANTGWRVVAVTPEGAVEYVGGKTNAERIDIPNDVTEYWVVAE
jgi:ABC-type glycerol-3-phosphate transport system substrate-binding protein